MKLTIAAAFLCLYVASAGATLPVCKKANGNYTGWLKWSPCSVSCGKGYQQRHRFCDNPIPHYGGAKCIGPSTQRRSCNNGDCPPQGVLGEWIYTPCSASCGGGTKTKYRHCIVPTDVGNAQCYDACPNNPTFEVSCNTQKCPPPGPVVTSCYQCKQKAERDANKSGKKDFVGNACRIDKKWCRNLNGGIRDMYPAKSWFFVHCSPDGPWCKPCATRTLVYNPSCGQCETKRYGPCTGPQKWRNTNSPSDEFSEDLDDDLEEWK